MGRMMRTKVTQMMIQGSSEKAIDPGITIDPGTTEDKREEEKTAGDTGGIVKTETGRRRGGIEGKRRREEVKITTSKKIDAEKKRNINTTGKNRTSLQHPTQAQKRNRGIENQRAKLHNTGMAAALVLIRVGRNRGIENQRAKLHNTGMAAALVLIRVGRNRGIENQRAKLHNTGMAAALVLIRVGRNRGIENQRAKLHNTGMAAALVLIRVGMLAAYQLGNRPFWIASKPRPPPGKRRKRMIPTPMHRQR